MCRRDSAEGATGHGRVRETAGAFVPTGKPGFARPRGRAAHKSIPRDACRTSFGCAIGAPRKNMKTKRHGAAGMDKLKGGDCRRGRGALSTASQAAIRARSVPGASRGRTRGQGTQRDLSFVTRLGSSRNARRLLHSATGVFRECSGNKKKGAVESLLPCLLVGPGPAVRGASGPASFPGGSKEVSSRAHHSARQRQFRCQRVRRAPGALHTAPSGLCLSPGLRLGSGRRGPRRGPGSWPWRRAPGPPGSGPTRGTGGLRGRNAPHAASSHAKPWASWQRPRPRGRPGAAPSCLPSPSVSSRSAIHTAGPPDLPHVWHGDPARRSPRSPPGAGARACRAAPRPRPWPESACGGREGPRPSAEARSGALRGCGRGHRLERDGAEAPTCGLLLEPRRLCTGTPGEETSRPSAGQGDKRRERSTFKLALGASEAATCIQRKSLLRPTALPLPLRHTAFCFSSLVLLFCFAKQRNVQAKSRGKYAWQSC